MLFLKLVILSLLIATSLGMKKKQEPNPSDQSDNSGSGGIVFLKSDNGSPLGAVSSTDSVDSFAFQDAATTTLQHILTTHAKATGQEIFSLAKGKKPIVDKLGRTHMRFEQSMDGLPVAGAAMMMHMDEQGDVFAVNGEYVAEDSINKEVKLGCDKVFLNIASNPYYHSTGLATSTWLTDCEPAFVVDNKGKGHKTWQRLLGYQPDKGPYQKDLMFASVQTGDIVAVHPKVYGALSLETYDCHNTFGTNCDLVSDSSNPINTGDEAINDAHNFAIDTYNFYKEQYGRDSLDDQGLTLISRVHVGENYANAGWTGTQMIYGDGDGVVITFLSKSIDVVGHELTHGVTEFSSDLIYRDESGALNEAISDIFGATISRDKGKQTPKNVWLIAEDIFIEAGKALRDMSNPYAVGKSADFYYTRYRGYNDNGKIHSNSGIANLAYYLLVSGGTHPRGLSPIKVQAIDPDFDTSILKAAEIFYMANTACLTPHSGFFAARECTIMHAPPAFVSNVEDAWSAVGVFESNNELTDGVSFSVPNLPAGDTAYATLKNIPAFSLVTCKTSGSKGNVDITVDIHSFTGPANTCVSEGPGANEVCTVGPARSEGTAVISIHALEASSGVTIACSASDPNAWPKLKNGVKKTNIPSGKRARKVFILDNVPARSSVTCMTKINELARGDALYVDLISHSASASCEDTQPDIKGLYSCFTKTIGAVGKAYVTLELYEDSSISFLSCKISGRRSHSKHEKKGANVH